MNLPPRLLTKLQEYGFSPDTMGEVNRDFLLALLLIELIRAVDGLQTQLREQDFHLQERLTRMERNQGAKA